MLCPFCKAEVEGPRGLAAHFRHQSETHPVYSAWKADQKWSDKVEGVDYVRCLECGERAATLARHLKAAHAITADQYREKHGQDVLIRAAKVTAKRKAAIKRGRASDAYKGTKMVPCSTCGQDHEVHLLSQVVECLACKQAAEEQRWAGKTAPEDYVCCLECDYRAENLTSHITSSHPDYRQNHPEAPITALCAAQRDNPLLGSTPSLETRQRMSDNAGRWNKGLTKETDERVAAQSEKMLGKPSWSKGLTAGEDPRLAETARKLAMYVGENRPWDNGLAADLTLKDFQPFQDDEGRVDHHKATEALGVSWVTLRKYISDVGLEQSRRYILEGAEDRTIRLEKEALEAFKLKNGKVPVGRAMVGLGHSYSVIKRECDRHGLPTFNRRISQTICLDAVSQALGGVAYVEEWKSWRFTNPPTGHRFRFDGYFEDVGLIVEFQGHQHYTFPNAFMSEDREDLYLGGRERDRIKRELIQAASDLTLLEVMEDEPYDDPSYLKGRLHQMGLPGV